jgi:hypothetical protein
MTQILLWIGAILFVLQVVLGLLDALISKAEKEKADVHAVRAWSKIHDLSKVGWLKPLRSVAGRSVISVLPVLAALWIFTGSLGFNPTFADRYDTILHWFHGEWVEISLYLLVTLMGAVISIWLMSRTDGIFSAILSAALLLLLALAPVGYELSFGGDNERMPPTMVASILLLFGWLSAVIPVATLHILQMVLLIMEFILRRIAESDNPVKSAKSFVDSALKILKGS